MNDFQQQGRGVRISLWGAITGVALCLVAGCGDSGLVTKGTPPEKPWIRITGPAKQRLSLGVCYFDVDGGSKSRQQEGQTLYLSEEGAFEMDLESGHDGFAIDLVVPTDQRVRLELLSRDEVVKSAESDSPLRMRIVAGKTTDEDEIADDIRLSAEDRELVKGLIDSMVDGSIAGSISSDEEMVQVDAVVLTEMMRVMTKRFGPIKELHPQRWSKQYARDDVSWDCIAPVEFEDGSVVRFGLIVNDGKLMALRALNEAFEKDWSEDAAAGETYAAVGRTLVSDLIEKRYDAAYAKLGPDYKKQASLEQMIDYREIFSKLPASGIKEIKLQKCETLEGGDDICRRVLQTFLVSYEGSEVEGVVRVLHHFLTGVSWKMHEIRGFEIEEL